MSQTEPQPDWVRPPSRVSRTSTPWGTSQRAVTYARGIISYSCAGHGGIHLSPTVNAKVPDALRVPEGWYEEDFEALFVIAAFPHVFGPASQTLPYAKAAIRESDPDLYTAWTGEPVTAAESSVVAEREFFVQHAEDWVVAGRVEKADTIAVGMICVEARRGKDMTRSDSETVRFLVPEEEYEARDRHFVVDPGRHAVLSSEMIAPYAAQAKGPTFTVADLNVYDTIRDTNGRLGTVLTIRRTSPDVPPLDLTIAWSDGSGVLPEVRETSHDHDEVVQRVNGRRQGPPNWLIASQSLEAGQLVHVIQQGMNEQRWTSHEEAVVREVLTPSSQHDLEVEFLGVNSYDDPIPAGWSLILDRTYLMEFTGVVPASLCLAADDLGEVRFADSQWAFAASNPGLQLST